MKVSPAADQVERADERDKRRISLAADVASSAVLLGLVAAVTVVVILPLALVLGVLL